MTDTSIWERLIVSATCAVFAETVSFPLDLLRTRIQVEKTREPIPKIYRDILQTEGVKGLYAGLSAAALRQLIYGGTTIALYSPVRTFLNGDRPSDAVPLYLRFLAASLTGAFGQFVASPTGM